MMMQPLYSYSRDLITPSREVRRRVLTGKRFCLTQRVIFCRSQSYLQRSREVTHLCFPKLTLAVSG